MIFDEIDFSNLPENREEAFTDFVKNISVEFSRKLEDDRRTYSDQDGSYGGSYEPERSFVTAILAFLDEYGIDAEISDISELSNQEFANHFGKFKSKVEYLTTRFKLRQGRIKNGSIGTLITIEFSYKADIGKLLDTARKIVNQEVKDQNKKDKILSKISSLQSEVDRDQTTVDALFGRMLDLTQVIGDSVENLTPLIDKLERVKKIFWENPRKVEQLPKPDRPKMITQESIPTKNNYDDEIPF